MNLELIVCLNLHASHSLEEREAPHSHRWEIQVGLRGSLEKGRVVSLTEAQKVFSEVLRPLQNTFLNENKYLDCETQRNPTCENLANFLLKEFQNRLADWEKSRKVEMSFIQVGLWENEGLLGFAKLSI